MKMYQQKSSAVLYQKSRKALCKSANCYTPLTHLLICNINNAGKAEFFPERIAPLVQVDVIIKWGQVERWVIVVVVITTCVDDVIS